MGNLFLSISLGNKTRGLVWVELTAVKKAVEISKVRWKRLSLFRYLFNMGCLLLFLGGGGKNSPRPPPKNSGFIKFPNGAYSKNGMHGITLTL